MAQFFLGNPAIDQTVKALRRKLRLLMNGETSQSMREKGLHYKINWGVSLQHIKELATELTPSHDLAVRLWAMKHRETMILATMLEPIDKFDDKQLSEWLQDVNNIEIIEHLSMNLLAKHPQKTAWAIELIQADSLWHQILGFTLITRISREIDDLKVAETIIDRVVTLANTEEYFLYRALATSASRICRNGENFVAMIKNKIAPLHDTEAISTKYIISEIENEISFLED